MTREDALYLEYREAEEGARMFAYECSLATECAACGAAISDSPFHDDSGALCEACAKKEEETMKVQDALKATAEIARGRAKYFEARAGRGSTKHIPAATNEIERARCEREAAAFGQAADVIEEIAQEGYWK